MQNEYTEYVEKEEIIRLLKEHTKDGDNGTFISDVTAKQIENFPPSEDVRENVKGKWTEKEVIHKDEAIYMIEEWQSMRCDQCNHYLTTPYMYYFDHFNFCPFCGAKMKKEGEQNVSESN